MKFASLNIVMGGPLCNLTVCRNMSRGFGAVWPPEEESKSRFVSASATTRHYQKIAGQHAFFGRAQAKVHSDQWRDGSRHMPSDCDPVYAQASRRQRRRMDAADKLPPAVVK